jgi:excisionase family DNA binding protein
MDGNQNTVEKFLLTPRQTAEALGICERTLYALSKSGELPVVRIGRAVRYSVEDIRTWIERAKKISEIS